MRIYTAAFDAAREAQAPKDLSDAEGRKPPCAPKFELRFDYSLDD